MKGLKFNTNIEREIRIKQNKNIDEIERKS